MGAGKIIIENEEQEGRVNRIPQLLTPLSICREMNYDLERIHPQNLQLAGQKSGLIKQIVATLIYLKICESEER
jgi:hypothetical protein